MYPTTTSRTYDPLAIANYFLGKAKAERRSIDPMGLQKLVYFAHGWSLALYNKPLISESVQAKDYGPAIPSLYDQFKRYGNEAIPSPGTVATATGPVNAFQWRLVAPAVDEGDGEAKSLLDRVWELYKGLSSIQLSNLAVIPGSPWKTVRDQGSSTIPNELIRDYFRAQMNGTR